MLSSTWLLSVTTTLPGGHIAINAYLRNPSRTPTRVAIQQTPDTAKHTATFADTGDTPCPAAAVSDTADTAAIQLLQRYSHTAHTVYSALHPTSGRFVQILFSSSYNTQRAPTVCLETRLETPLRYVSTSSSFF